MRASQTALLERSLHVGVRWALSSLNLLEDVDLDVATGRAGVFKAVGQREVFLVDPVQVPDVGAEVRGDLDVRVLDLTDIGLA